MGDQPPTSAAAVSALLIGHIAGGIVAIFAGAIAVSANKGGRLHAIAGTWFFASMLVLGVTASILAALTKMPDMGMGGIVVCYLVTTSWAAARRRSRMTGKFEIIACAVALGSAAIIASLGATEFAPPGGREPLFALAGLCLLAGLLDLNFILRGKLSGAQRISRHLWRMCLAFLMTTSFFFLGQQDVMPEAVRGSPVLWLLGLAPLPVMLFWMVRIRFAKIVGKLKLRAPSRPRGIAAKLGAAS